MGGILIRSHVRSWECRCPIEERCWSVEPATGTAGVADSAGSDPPTAVSGDDLTVDELGVGRAQEEGPLLSDGAWQIRGVANR